VSGVYLKPKIKNTFIFDVTLRDICVSGGFKTEYCMFDTGATYCHMPFNMWKRLGFADYLLKNKSDLFSKIGIKLPTTEQLAFDMVPCEFGYSSLGDGRQVSTFSFKLDFLEFKSIKYPDVTVKVFDANSHYFIIGNNVLMSSIFSWTPDIAENTEGQFYLQFDTAHFSLYKKFNSLQDKFTFLGDAK
jgi:hypothetical protein